MLEEGEKFVAVGGGQYLAEVVLLELKGKPLRRVRNENGLNLLAKD